MHDLHPGPPVNQADFTILGENADFLAVNKPAGMLVHPTRPGGPPTLWDGVCGLLGYELKTGGSVSIVNRLDRETSGVVVVAKHAGAARCAGIAMERREVEKHYEAVVFGHPPWDKIDLDAPVARVGEFGPSPVHLLRGVHPRGAPAQTGFRVMARMDSPHGPVALLAVRPLTGRTHQIRVHLAHLGFPVVGDKLYARGCDAYLEFIQTGWTPRLEARLIAPRHLLHCSKMRIAGNTFEAPRPADLHAFLSPPCRNTPNR